MNYQLTHPSYEVHCEIYDNPALTDVSDHNDESPSFEIHGSRFEGPTGLAHIRVWVNDGEYVICSHEDGYEPIYAVDVAGVPYDEGEVKNYLKTDNLRLVLLWIKDFTTGCVFPANVAHLAHHFRLAMREYVGMDVCRAVDRANTLTFEKNVCSSHDVCDANMPMERAFFRCFGRRPNCASRIDANMINAAWDRTKKIRFGAYDEKTQFMVTRLWEALKSGDTELSGAFLLDLSARVKTTRISPDFHARPEAKAAWDEYRNPVHFHMRPSREDGTEASTVCGIPSKDAGCAVMTWSKVTCKKCLELK